MVVLADEILESFFETDFTSTFKLEPVPMMDIPSHTGLLGDLWTSLTSDDNKKIFNRFTDGVGRAVGKHQVSRHKISIHESYSRGRRCSTAPPSASSPR